MNSSNVVSIIINNWNIEIRFNIVDIDSHDDVTDASADINTVNINVNDVSVDVNADDISVGINVADVSDDQADAPHYYDYLAATNRMMMNGVAKKNNTSINA